MFRHRGADGQTTRWILACGLISLIGAVVVALPIGDGLANLSYDVAHLFRGRVTDSNVVVVLEDRASLDALGQTQFPPSRIVHAKLVDRLREQGVKLIVFDISFRAEKPDEDAELARAIRDHGGVILGAVLETTIHNVDQSPGVRIKEAKPPPAVMREAAMDWGLLTVGYLDSDFGVRRIVTGTAERDSVVWRAARRLGSVSEHAIRDQERWMNHYGPTPALDSVTLAQVLEVDGRRLRPGFLKGKTVFVGFDPSVTPASGQRDQFATPFTRFGHDFSPGVEILANAFANLHSDDWLRRLNAFTQTIIAVLWGTGVTLGSLYIGRRGARWLVPTAALSLFAVAVTVQWQYHVWWNWLVPVLIQSPLALLAAMATARMPRVAFISYRRSGGKDFALALLNALRLRDYDAALDVNDLQVGPFPAQLLRNLEKAPCTIVVLSPGALDQRFPPEDDWMRKELLHARTTGKPIIPIWINGFTMNDVPALPAELEPIREIRAIVHDHLRWEATIGELLQELKRLSVRRTPDAVHRRAGET